MTKTKFRAAALAGTALAVLALAGCNGENGDFDVTTQMGADPVLPEPEDSLIPDLKVAPVVGWQPGETPTVAEGLTISAYATDLANPRTVHTLPNGDVLVVQSRGPEGSPPSRPKDIIRGWIMAISHGDTGPQKESNLVTLLRDTNRDGVVDERHDLLTGLTSPFGLAFADNTLYVAAADAILAYPYTPGQTEITEPPRVLTPLPGGPINHHWTKDLALSPDGRYLYASVGSNSNIVENGLEAEKGRAAIWQIDRQTGAARVYASGLRNPNGLSFNPETGALWAVINERDELGPNLVPDYMTSVQEGAFYGWPWSYYGDHVDARVHPQRPDMVEKAIAPDYALSSHVAALGLTFAAGSALPAPYTTGAFVGEHGSWNRDAFNGYKVGFIAFEAGKPVGKVQDVVTGFLDGENVRGRPVGVGIDGTGALLVADDAGNTVWRVANADGSVIPQPIATDQGAATTAAAPGVPDAAATTTTAVDAAAPTAPVTGAAAPAPTDAPAASSPDAAAAPAAGNALSPVPMQVAPGEVPAAGATPAQ